MFTVIPAENYSASLATQEATRLKEEIKGTEREVLEKKPSCPKFKKRLETGPRLFAHIMSQ